MKKIEKLLNFIVFVIFIFCILGMAYNCYDEAVPHNGCKNVVEIPIEFEDYAVTSVCSATYADSIGPYSSLRVCIIGDIPSDFRLGNTAKLIIHRGSIAKWGFKPHCVIEFKGKPVNLGYYSIYLYGYKNGNSEKLCLEEIVGYMSK